MEVSEMRKQKRENTQMIPKNMPSKEGLVIVDTTWGMIQPIKADEKVVTVGELEVIEHQEKKLQIIDARVHEASGTPTIKGSQNIPHSEIVERMDELNREQPTVFFCNGPQCSQSPTAIQALLEAGYPHDKVYYYRGGMHDWITLGLPTEKVVI